MMQGNGVFIYRIPKGEYAMTMEFGTITRDDLPELVRLQIDLIEEIRDETGDDYFLYDTERASEIAEEIASIFDNPRKIIYIARDGDCIAGFIAGEVRSCFFPLSKAGPVGYIAGAYVRPMYRKKGVARRLEEMLVRFFREHGAAYAELGVMSKNRLAKKSWNSLGYATFRELMKKQI